MVTPPYPLQPEPMKRSWMERHPLWKIPLGCLTLFVLISGFGVIVITVVFSSIRHSDVYKQALTMAEGNQQVREQIGQPIEAGWLITGQLNVEGSTGNANLSIPVSGPRGKGRIRAVARKRGGIWTFSWLQMNVDGQADAIDLLAAQPAPST